MNVSAALSDVSSLPTIYVVSLLVLVTGQLRPDRLSAPLLERERAVYDLVGTRTSRDR